ncbi:MAG: MBL fold metallo-hydrolase [Chloroflexi bacterium]|nr:MBL fold metallo-hydrolase [Chloroflexota bacterium]
MPKLIILGTSDSVPDENHDNTHMLLIGKTRRVLVDCASNPVMRLRRIGVEPNSITDIIMTHFHPDHVSGVPLLLMNMWLLGRHDQLNLYGLEHTVRLMEQLLDAFEWERWQEYPVDIKRLRNKNMTLVLEAPDLRIVSYPVNHFVPAIGLRFEFPGSGKVVAYTSDTAPTANVAWLAQGADILLHEASGESEGHSSAAQAGEMAKQAKAKALYLIHYPTGLKNPQDLVAEASRNFDGPVVLAEDFMEFEFD